MQYITFTELRTNSKKLAEALSEGRSINLIHRSKVVGRVQPIQEQPKPLTKEDIEEIKKLAKELNLPKTSYKQREKLFRKHLREKYGQGLS